MLTPPSPLPPRKKKQLIFHGQQRLPMGKLGTKATREVLEVHKMAFVVV